MLQVVCGLFISFFLTDDLITFWLLFYVLNNSSTSLTVTSFKQYLKTSAEITAITTSNHSEPLFTVRSFWGTKSGQHDLLYQQNQSHLCKICQPNQPISIHLALEEPHWKCSCLHYIQHFSNVCMYHISFCVFLLQFRIWQENQSETSE